MLTTNAQKLAKISVQGKIQHPVVTYPYRMDQHGIGHILPGTGGIVYNIKVGDSAYGWVADHIEPGVTVKNDNLKYNMALNVYTCIGNEAKVVSGEAKGAKGYVTGTHGGIEHIIIDFDASDMEKMHIDDVVQIKAYGQGLQLVDYPEISIMNIDPRLFSHMGITEKDGKLQVPVCGFVPAHLMGSGIGSVTAARGDYDIMTTDREEIRKHALHNLKLGDLLLLQDCDNSFGRAYLKDSVSIGVIVHGDSVKMGHGPGVAIVMTSKKPLMEGILNPEANISKLGLAS